MSRPNPAGYKARNCVSNYRQQAKNSNKNRNWKFCRNQTNEKSHTKEECRDGPRRRDGLTQAYWSALVSTRNPPHTEKSAETPNGNKIEDSSDASIADLAAKVATLL